MINRVFFFFLVNTLTNSNAGKYILKEITQSYLILILNELNSINSQIHFIFNYFTKTYFFQLTLQMLKMLNCIFCIVSIKILFNNEYSFPNRERTWWVSICGYRDELINCSSLKRRENWIVTRKYIIYVKIQSIK